MSEQKEISVEEKLRALFDLQLIESEIDKIKTLRGELPLEVKDLEDELEGLKTREQKLQDDIDHINSMILAKEREKDESKAAIEKFTAQQNNVRNNREYDNFAKEIEYQTLNIQLSEKKIKESKAAIEDKKSELEATKAKIDDRTLDLNHKKNELDAIISETKQQEEELRAKALNNETLIDERMLNAFKKIRKNAHNGLAVVRVKRNACGGCFNQIPPQRRIDIAQRKRVIVCEYCGRIMVDLELGNEEVLKTGYGEQYVEEVKVEAKKEKTRASKKDA